MPKWDTALLALFAVSDSTEMACFQIRMGNTNKGIKRKRVKVQYIHYQAATQKAWHIA